MSQPQSPTRMMAALALQPEKAVGDDELEAFRRQWKAEVATRRTGAEPPPAPVTSKDVAPEVESTTLPKATRQGKAAAERTLSPKATSRAPFYQSTATPKPPLSPTKQRWDTGEPSSPPPRSTRKPTNGALSTSPDSSALPFPKNHREHDSAVTLYAQAVEAEQSGQLNDALHLYRKAFRANDNVDKLYAVTVRHQDQAAKNKTSDQTTQPGEDEKPQPVQTTEVVDPAGPEDEPYAFTRHVQVKPDYEKATGSVASVSRLAGLISSRVGVVPEDHEGPYDPAAEFKPEEEEAPLPIAQLPSEIVEHVLERLDVASLEAFGSTCWHARLLTANSRVWKQLVQRIYRPPMTDLKAEQIIKRHHGEWRSTLIEEARLRMDGCYISVCHYIRPGAGEQWVAITHMITYHRFLRFYPDGFVISFLTTDHPSDVVPVLKRDVRAKGFHLGRWQLVQDVDEKGKKRVRVLITDLMEPGGNGKYEFEMELGLRETHRGRWNKLDMKSYSSIQVATGEILGLSLKHQKPFYFSKVRSYTQTL